MTLWIALLTANTLSAAPAVKPAPLAELPAALIGAWGVNDASCANANDDGRVTIGPTSVTFYASQWSLKTILSAADKTIQASALVQEEGLEDDEQDKSEHAIRLTLVTPTTLSIGYDGSDQAYQRCNDGASNKGD